MSIFWSFRVNAITSAHLATRNGLWSLASGSVSFDSISFYRPEYKALLDEVRPERYEIAYKSILNLPTCCIGLTFSQHSDPCDF
jgi:hypothetical protein